MDREGRRDVGSNAVESYVCRVGAMMPGIEWDAVEADLDQPRRRQRV